MRHTVRFIGTRSLVFCVGLIVIVAASRFAFAQHEGVVPKAEPSGAVDFAADVRPILAEYCFACHGPDEATRKARLRLDTREGALAKRRRGHVVVPGKPDESLLYQRLVAEDELDRMPPIDESEPLEASEIETLKRWIEQGAEWSGHWAYEPPVRAELPQLHEEDEVWARNAIDHFVGARRREAGLAPSAAATRDMWIRRVTFDLTGLPPTSDEVEAFLADDSETAFETVVDRLLASERYGERQAQEWLDAARYADTNGYQADSGRQAWKWREWVINAFNQNMPFDQFTIEQLAGDLLPDATTAQKVATGFNRNHPVNSEAGEEPDEYRSVYVIDRVGTTATTWLGLTLACAQCHDHKFDELSQKDFYKFYGFFNHLQERDGGGFGRSRSTLAVPTETQEPRVADLERRIQDLKNRLDQEDPVTDTAQRDWVQRTVERLDREPQWVTANPIGVMGHKGSILERLDDGSIQATGTAPVRDTYDLVLKPGKRKITAIRLEVLPPEVNHVAKVDEDAKPSKKKKKLPMSGRSDDGRFVLSQVKVRVSSLSDGSDPPLVYWAGWDTDLNQVYPEDPTPEDKFPGSLDGSIVVDDSNDSNGGGFGRRGGGGWSIVGDERNKPHEAILLPLETLDLNDVSVIHISMAQTSRPYKSLISRFRVSYTDDESVRELLLPTTNKLWSSVGPFPAQDVHHAFATKFEPEANLEKGMDLKRKFDPPKVPDPKKDASKGGKGGPSGGKGTSKGGSASKGGPGKASAKKSLGEASDASKGSTSEQPSASDGDSAKSSGKGGAKKGSKGGFKKGGSSAEAAPSDADSSADGSVKQAPAEKDGESSSSTADPSSAKSKKPAAKANTKKKSAEKKKTEKKKTETKSDKPGDAAKPDAPAEANQGRRRRPPPKLSWTEQRAWLDGRSFRLSGTNSVWYLTRKIESTRPRTAMVTLSGGDGAQIWVNGESVLSEAPTVPSPVKPERGAASNSGNNNDNFSNFRRRGGSSSARTVRIGLRRGENEIVVKVAVKGQPQSSSRRRGGGEQAAPEANENAEAMAAQSGNRGRNRGGISVTFDLDAEGDDVINHEVVTALRATLSDDRSDPGEIAAAATADDGSTAVRPATMVSAGDAAVATASAKSAPAAKAMSRQEKAVRDFYRRRVDTVGRLLSEELVKLESEKNRIERTMPQTLVMKERDKKRETRVFIRGSYKNRGDKVDSDVPTVLPDLPADAPRDRLGLAKWLVSNDNPLTSRVTVNRLWQQYFGTGLVDTPDDFGTRGSRPSHPALLDWLAVEFRESGWDLKKLHRTIVLSATYRQSSDETDELREIDADNRLLARAPRLRLSAEMIRDNALSVSGLLVNKVGGPSVRPYQPDGLWESVSRGQRYRRDKGPDQYRRGLYVYWKRGVPYPSMITFDAAKRETCTVKRDESTTPLQALVLMNDQAFVEAGKMLGHRLLKEGGKTDKERLAYGFRLCTSRHASDQELAILADLLANQREHFKDEKLAKEFLSIGDSKTDVKAETGEIAAWASVGRALLNLDATIHRG